MADALISLLIETLGSMAFEKIKEEIGLLRGVEEEIENLKTTLVDIQSVLEDAEKRQLTSDPAVRNWLDKLKDASLDIDDLLDEWLTPIALNSKMEEAVSVKKKVWLSLLSRCICSGGGPIDHVVVRHRIANEMKELNENLDRIAKAKDRYQLVRADLADRSLGASPPLRKITTSLLNEKEVCGREMEKEVLMKMLVPESGSSDHEGRGFGMVAIVGIAGLGKTTLAQLVYNDDEVKRHFHTRMWVCVPDPFDEIRVAKAILGGHKGISDELNDPVQRIHGLVDGKKFLLALDDVWKGSSSDELNDLVQRIHGLVDGKKFLLVLDDVWDGSYSRWEELMKSLANGAAGSRILVTTRNEEVARKMWVAECDMMKLETMSNEHCWQIFSQLAFFDRTEEERRRMENIGRKISEKSKGLPLIAKTLGGLMCFKTINEWNTVLNNKLWKLKDDQEIFAPLLLSYYNLSPSEKRCLLYCSVFPKDYEIEKGMLVRMWMSQGFLGCKVNLEEEGEACFESLARRSFFHDFTKSEFDGTIKTCKMHDIVCDFLKFLTKDEYRVVEDLAGVGVDNNQNALNERTRHLTINTDANMKILGDLKYKDEDRTKLRTLFFTSSFSSDDQVSLFLHQTRIRTLSFSFNREILKDIGKLLHLRYLKISFIGEAWELPDSICDLYNLQTLYLYELKCANLPKNIGKLRNLRYLNLKASRITALPDSISNLSKLKTLILGSCYWLERLPVGLGKLVGLRHLDISYCTKLVALPKGLASLTGLQTLKMLFPITKDNESNMSIADLKALRHVLKYQFSFALSWCTNIQSASEAREIGVTHMESLFLLLLKFGNDQQRIEEKGIEDREKEILEAIEPTPSLQLLVIEDYMGTTVSPKWMMSLTNLKRLGLYECHRCHILPPLGKLPSLKELRIWRFDMLEEVGSEFLGLENVDEKEPKGDLVSFPKLKELTIQHAKRWKSWMGSERDASSVIMPCLNSLTLENCDSLETLPDFLPWEKIKIINCKFLKRQ